MTLVLKILPTEAPDSTGFYIEDTTGSYNASTNLTGYGIINPNITDVLTCVATITKPDSTTFLPSTDPSFTITKDVYYGTPPNVLPNTTGVRQFIDAVDDLGYDEFMQNGIYAVSITAGTSTDPPALYTSDTYYMLVYNSLVCCITKQYLTVNLDECGDCLKRDSAVWNTMLGQFYLNGAYYAWLYAVADATGDFSKCAEYLIAVTDICNNCTNCGC